jgi:hypothetical protein
MSDDRSLDQTKTGHDHIYHATAKFCGDPREGFWWIGVAFRDHAAIDELIGLLQDLRDHPVAQGHHIHLQDYCQCDIRPEAPPWVPEGTEIIFFGPGHEFTDTDTKLWHDGAGFMRSHYRPPKPLNPLPED